MRHQTLRWSSDFVESNNRVIRRNRLRIDVGVATELHCVTSPTARLDKSSKKLKCLILQKKTNCDFNMDPRKRPLIPAWPFWIDVFRFSCLLATNP